MEGKVLLVDAISVQPDYNDDLWNFENEEAEKYLKLRTKAISEFLGKDVGEFFIDDKYKSNYGLLMLSYLLKKENIPVGYTNGDYFDSEEAFINDMITEYKNYEIFCFTSVTAQYNQVKRLASAIKHFIPNSKIILGGPHTKYFLNHEKEDMFDYIVTGYGLDKSVALIKNLLNGEKPRFWRIDTTNYYDCPKDFSIIPEDKRKETIWYNYFEMGCPHRCKYCVEPHNFLCYSQVKERMDEVEYAIKTFDLSMFHFCDSDFFLNEKVVEEVIDEINRRDLKFTWTVNVGPTSLIKIADKPIFKRCKENGLVEILLGAEHFSENVRSRLSKNYNNDDFLRALDIAKHKVKIPVISIFSMVGLPFEHEEDIDINVKFFKKMREKDLFDFVYPKFFVPYPGSDIYENPEKYDIKILTDDFDYYNRKKLVRPVKINGMDDKLYVKEIIDLIKTNV